MAQYQTRGGIIDFAASNAQGTQGLVRVVGLRDGGFGVSWIGADADRTSFDGDVFGRVYSANLTPTTAGAINLITDTGPSSSYPVNQALTELVGGGFALFTTDNARYDPAAAANNRDVAVRLYDASGTAIGPPVYLGSASVLGVTVTTLEDGRLVAGWIDTDGALRAQYLAPSGSLVGQSFIVASPQTDFAARPDFAALQNGGWVATYIAQNSSDAHAIFFDPQGNASADRVVASDLNNIEGLQTYELADNRVVLVWAQQATNHLETHAQIYSPDGTAFGTELTLSTTSSSVVSVTGLADGGFVVALEPAASGPLEVKIYNSIGQQNGSTLTFAGAIQPSIAALADGGFVVTWKDDSSEQFHAQAFQAVATGDLALNGGAAADTLVGQEGNDTLNGLAGADQLFGSVGNDRLFGGDGSDVLDGGAGSDFLDGGTGIDTMRGGLGDDRYTVDNAADQVLEDAGGGHDLVAASLSYRLQAGTAVEILQTTSHAGTAAINLTGNEFANIVIGNAGKNILDGGAGADKLQGLGGDDRYLVDNAGDQVFETSAGGYDLVAASVSYRLQAGTSIEVLQTDSHAGTAAINLTGNELANIVIGNAGNNILDGGAGADKLQGLGGDDRYIVDNAGDQVFEAANGGHDLVAATVSYRLQAGTSVEILQTTSHAGTLAINLTGNELANIVIGNAGNNILDGGAGADKMQGLGGDDRYIVDNAGDQVFEAANGGHDLVAANVSYRLQAGASVEILQTTSHAGTAAINLTGNELSNIVIGNAGANTLDGGAGADKLQGLGGDDRYLVDNIGDQVFEATNGGHDVVAASVSYTLQTGTSVEVLQTTSHAGTAAINLTGNGLANNVIGNAGANTLDGGGGADNLLGLGGNDTFVLHQGFQSAGILDFTSGQDRIDLKGFAGLATGGLAADAFGTGASATTASQRVIYNDANGALFFDADGNGANGAVQIAQLSAHLAITHNDFIIG